MHFRLPFSSKKDEESIELWTNDDSNISNTSTVGYVPLEKRVNALLQAGENLESMREIYYGIEDTADDSDFDVDTVDVSQFDSKIDLMTEVKNATRRLNASSKKKKSTATDSNEVVDKSEGSKESPADLSTTSNSSEVATEDTSTVK